MSVLRLAGPVLALVAVLVSPAAAGAALVDLGSPVAQSKENFTQAPHAIVVAKFSSEPSKGPGLAASMGTGGSSAVRILLTSQLGNWATPPSGSTQDVSAGDAPGDLEAADFSGDGNLDLAVASSSGVRMMQGGFSGIFSAATTPAGSPGGTTSGVAFLRLPAQARPALVASTASSLYVYPNTNVFPAYNNPTGYAVDAGTTDVAVGDLDGDGDEDLATAVTSTQLASVLLGNGGSFGGLRSAGLFTRPGALTVADLDGNGRAEVIVAEPDRGTVGIVSTAGLPASLGPVQRIATGVAPVDVAAADLDGDGRPELVVANAGSGTVSIADHTGAVKSFAAGPTPISVSIAEVTGDSRPDVVVANESTKRVSILANLGVPPGPPAPPAPALTPARLKLKKLSCAPKPQKGEVRQIVCAVQLNDKSLAKSVKAALSRKQGKQRILATASAKPGSKLKLSVKAALAPGAYRVKLTVAKKAGGKLSAERTVTIAAPPR